MEKYSKNLITFFNRLSKKGNDKYKYYIIRIGSLIEKQFVIESFLLEVAIIENLLIYALEIHLDIEYIMSKRQKIINKKIKLNEKTLGWLIKELKKHHKEGEIKLLSESSLIKRLEEFKDIRNKISHNLFNENLTEVEDEIKKHYGLKYPLLVDLMLYSESLKVSYLSININLLTKQIPRNL